MCLSYVSFICLTYAIVNMCVYNIWTCSCVKSSKQCYKETKANTSTEHAIAVK